MASCHSDNTLFVRRKNHAVNTTGRPRSHYSTSTNHGIPRNHRRFVTVQFGGFGLLTFVHLFAFAILAASMTEYKTEIGLWMLALLFAGCWSGLIAMYTFGQIIDLRRGVALNGTVAIDAFF